MKIKTQSFLVTAVILVIIRISFAQTNIPAGDVSDTWNKANSSYLINGEITIPNGQTLTIEPGVRVEFQGHYKLNVQGRLLAVGAETDSIVFTINDTTGFSNPDIPDGGWFGIRFMGTSSQNDSSKISYCKLQYGKAVESDGPDGSGGAISVVDFDKLIISNCLITNNIASGGDGPVGGGIALWNSNPKIIGNTISYNSARFGGGIQCYESSPQIVDNLIVNNIAEGGGGIVCNEYSNPTITNTTIEYNDGGGINCWGNSSPSLVNVTITGNTGFWGGGIVCGESSLSLVNVTISENLATVAGGINAAFSNIQIDKCNFINNAADNYAGLRFRDCDFTLSNSTFKGNTAVQYIAGAGFSTECLGTVSNCLFASNIANTRGENWNSGGVSVWSESNVNFINCTFANNSAAYGGGLTVGGGGIAYLTNCIFWQNSPDQIALDTFNNLSGTLTVNYCDIQDGEDSINVIDPLSTLVWGSGNIDSHPSFADTGNGDYHLQDNSPCIGAGIASIEIDGIWHYCPSTDIEGNPRPNPAGSMPDIGACESELGEPVGIEDVFNIQPIEFCLFQNYPNPFNPNTTIEYQLSELSQVDLSIYNLLGQKISTLVFEKQPAGTYKVEWDASGFSSGVYLYKIQTDQGFSMTKKLVLIK